MHVCKFERTKVNVMNYCCHVSAHVTHFHSFLNFFALTIVSFLYYYGSWVVKIQEARAVMAILIATMSQVIMGEKL